MPFIDLKGKEIKRDLSKPLKTGEKRVVLLLREDGFGYKFDGDILWTGADIKRCWRLLRQAYRLYKYHLMRSPAKLNKLLKEDNDG